MYTSVLFHVYDMNEIRLDLSASIQVVNGDCIFFYNDVFKGR